jgi:hypothetical protein
MISITILAVIASLVNASSYATLSGVDKRATFYGDPTDVAKGELGPFDPNMYGACGPKRDDAPEGIEHYYAAISSLNFDPETPMASYGHNSWGNPLCGLCLKVTHRELKTQTVVYLVLFLF